MDRRVAAALLAGGLLVATVAATTLVREPPRVVLSDSPHDADRVTLYQNGLAFVEFSRTFNATGEDTTLVFSLPDRALFDSVSLEGDGVVVKRLRSSLADGGPIQPGDDVVAHVDGATFAGRVVSLEGGRLLLAADDRTVLVEADKASAIEVLRRSAPPPAPGAAHVSALVQAPEGEHTVRLTYLVMGTGWTPSYRLDLPENDAVLFATLTGVADWKGVRLDLVAGAPHLVARPHAAPAYRAVADAYAGDAASARGLAYDVGFSSPEALGSLLRFSYGEPVDFQRGETVRLALLEGRLEEVRHYYEASATASGGGFSGTGSQVPLVERMELRNAFGERLPPGLVRFYRNGVFVGEDVLPALPVDQTANVTLAAAEDLEARLVLEKTHPTSGADAYTYALTVKNLRKDKAEVDLRALLHVPSYRTRITMTEPAPTEETGAAVAWDGALEGGGTRVFRVAFETQRY